MLTASLRLPFTFDPQELLHDLSHCLGEWPKHFNSKDYEGNWSSVALRSTSGKADDIIAHPNLPYTDTPLMAICPTFKSAVDSFKCPIDGVRLLRLTPGSIIKEHRDQQAGYLEKALRIHIPVQTNPGVDFRVNGERIIMQAGECWYADFSMPHSVRNDGDADRIHLVIDAARNEWTDELFREAGYDFEAEKQAKKLKPETRQRMIEELLLQDNDAARMLIAKLQQEAGD